LRADLINYILSFSIIIPLLAGLMRIKHIHQSYFSFLLFLFFGFITELTAFFIYDISQINLIQDVYGLISICMLLVLFYQWGLLKHSIKKLIIYLVLLITIETLDYLVQPAGSIKIPWGYLLNIGLITASSLFLLNTEFSNQHRLFFKQPRVLILIPLIIYYIYFMVVNLLMAFLFNSHTQKLFINLYNVINYINLFRYLSFTLAFLWAPKKEKYL
jgi:hypothetical protein